MIGGNVAARVVADCFPFGRRRTRCLLVAAAAPASEVGGRRETVRSRIVSKLGCAIVAAADSSFVARRQHGRGVVVVVVVAFADPKLRLNNSSLS